MPYRIRKQKKIKNFIYIQKSMNRQSKSEQKTQPENYIFWSPTVPSRTVIKYSAGTKRDV